MSIERMLVQIDASTERLRRELRRADKATGKYQHNSSRHLKKLDRDFDRFQKRQARRMKQLAGMYAGFAATRGIANGFRSVVNSAANLQTAMIQLEAVSSATQSQLADLRQEALRLGSSTQYTAGQVAGGMNELAKAGQNPLKILGSIESALTLATAAQIDMAQATDIVTNVMAGFGHDTSRLEKDIDTLVATFTGSNTVITELGDAFKYAGATASANNFSFEETASVFALMANAGIKGEMAGTSLRGAIVKMVNPSGEAKRAMQALGISFTDSEGRLRKFSDILTDLQPHYKNTQFFAQVFGQRAMNAMQILARQGGAALEEFSEKIDKDLGKAQKIAGTRMKGLRGSMKELTSATEGLSIEMDDRTGLTAWLEKMARAAAKAARELTSLSKVERGLANLDEFDELIATQKKKIDDYNSRGVIDQHLSFFPDLGFKLAGTTRLDEYQKNLADLIDQRSKLQRKVWLKGIESEKEWLLKIEDPFAEKMASEAKVRNALSTPGFWKAKTQKNPIAGDLTDINREIAAMQSQRAEMSMTAGEIARLNTSRDIYNGLQDRGIALTDEDTQALERQLNKLRDAVNANAEYEKAMQDLQAVSDVVSQGMEDAFAKFTQTGKLDFEDMIGSMLQNLAKLAFQMSVIQPLFGGGSSGGGGGGLFGSLLGSLTGVPGRASGGPVSAGKLYNVNEMGSEMFIPNTNGMILNASKTKKVLAGGGAISVTFGDINVQSNASDPQEVANLVLDQVPALAVKSVAKARQQGFLS